MAIEIEEDGPVFLVTKVEIDNIVGVRVTARTVGIMDHVRLYLEFTCPREDAPRVGDFVPVRFNA